MWTIQQTLLIAVAGDLIETESLAILHPAEPGMLALHISGIRLSDWDILGANPGYANAEVKHPENFMEILV